MYSVDGTDQDWHYFAHGSVAYIIEGPLHNPTKQSLYTKSLQYMLPIFERLVQRVEARPRISGNVISSTGAPLSARVDIVEIKPNANERWLSRASDGRFDRLVVDKGVYTLRVSAKGYQTVTKKVTVSGVKEVQVVLAEEPRD